MMATAGSKSYNWNVRSKYYYIHSTSESKIDYESDVVDAIYHDKPQPTTDGEIKAFVSEHNLNHGDIINFGEYRHTYVAIVCRGTDGMNRWINNPDDHASGYMTIPHCVLEYVTDAINKYKGILKYMDDHNEPINMYISDGDKFIKGKFGEIKDKGYEFDVHFNGPDIVDGLFVRKCDTEVWGEFKWLSVTWNDITDDLNSRCTLTEKKAFNVKVFLQGESFDKYQAKHSKDGASKHYWRQARPKLEPGWDLAIGPSMGGTRKSGWVWKLQGPADSEDVIRTMIHNHFEDIPYEIVDSSDTSLTFN